MITWCVLKRINNDCTEALNNNSKPIHRSVTIRNTNQDMDETQLGVSVCLMEFAPFGHEWVGIQRCVVVQRHGYRDGEFFDEQQYYISSVIV